MKKTKKTILRVLFYVFCILFLGSSIYYFGFYMPKQYTINKFLEFAGGEENLKKECAKEHYHYDIIDGTKMMNLSNIEYTISVCGCAFAKMRTELASKDIYPLVKQMLQKQDEQLITKASSGFIGLMYPVCESEMINNFHKKY